MFTPNHIHQIVFVLHLKSFKYYSIKSFYIFHYKYDQYIIQIIYLLNICVESLKT